MEYSAAGLPTAWYDPATGLPRSWRHFTYVLGYLSRARARQDLRAAAAVGAGFGGGDESKQWWRDKETLAGW